MWPAEVGSRPAPREEVGARPGGQEIDGPARGPLGLQDRVASCHCSRGVLTEGAWGPGCGASVRGGARGPAVALVGGSEPARPGPAAVRLALPAAPRLILPARPEDRAPGGA